MSDPIADYLARHGPSRSSDIVAALQEQGVSAEAARQRISRVKKPVYRFPLRLLPKNEAFLYLDKQRNGELFWNNFLRDMRLTNSAFGMALDALIARGGTVYQEDFPTISGAPAKPTKGQITADRLRDTLVRATILAEHTDASGRRQVRYLGDPYRGEPQVRAEMILLDGIREWARRLGFAGYNSIAIRGEAEWRPIGPFQFDLAGPSWLAPFQPEQGFLVADVFVEGTLTEEQIRFFVRKLSIMRAMRKIPKVLGILVAPAYTGPALTAGHAAGIIMATPTTLFGRQVGLAMTSLVETLKNAAAYASAESPERITKLFDGLTEIEGRNGNLRGALFELAAAYLARRIAASIDMGVNARHPTSGATADIDILAIGQGGGAVTCIECKGKEPGGTVSEAEVTEWLAKTAIMRAYLAADRSLRYAGQRFEIWTSGKFSPEALQLLQREKQQRSKAPIDWKDGGAVLEFATIHKEKAVSDALRQHFFKHPLESVAREVATYEALVQPISNDQAANLIGPTGFGGTGLVSHCTAVSSPGLFTK